MDDFYAMLGVSPNATIAEIKGRYRFLAHAYHPDKFSTAAHKRDAEDAFKKINEAFQTLSNPNLRAAYDRQRTSDSANRAQSPPPPPRPAPPPQQRQQPSKPPHSRGLWPLSARTIIFLIVAVLLNRPEPAKPQVPSYEEIIAYGTLVTEPSESPKPAFDPSRPFEVVEAPQVKPARSHTNGGESWVPPEFIDAEIQSATKERPYVNSLGMKFVPIPIKGGLTNEQNVLFCVWETRVQDFRQYASETGYRQSGGASVLKIEPDGKDYSWKLDKEASWEQPGFEQGGDHPVICVSWEEARAFCAWLSTKEGRTYRLPTDAEWSAAVGLGKYPWGSAETPPKGAGNYAGAESKAGMPAKWGMIGGYDDGFPRTAPVARFSANGFGLYDVGGNVWEWCEDEYRAKMNEPDVLEKIPAFNKERSDDGTAYRVLRGGSWNSSTEFGRRSSCRNVDRPADRDVSVGFRCVLVVPRR